MILGNPSIIVQNMLGKTPESFNAVDMVFRFLVDHVFRVIDGEMFPQPLQGVVALERVGVIDRALSRFLPDDRHEIIGRDSLDHPCVHPSIPLQKPKYDAFAPCASSAPSLSP